MARHANFELIWIFSFLSGFLAMIPMFSSWIIWVPATIILIARDGVWTSSWVVMLALHMVAYFIDYVLYKLVGIDKQRPEVIGLAFIMGVYAFGWYGILMGPMVAGALLALLDIYKKYMPTENRVERNVTPRRHGGSATDSAYESGAAHADDATAAAAAAAAASTSAVVRDLLQDIEQLAAAKAAASAQAAFDEHLEASLLAASYGTAVFAVERGALAARLKHFANVKYVWLVECER
jgi:hypothetical protein